MKTIVSPLAFLFVIFLILPGPFSAEVLSQTPSSPEKKQSVSELGIQLGFGAIDGNFLVIPKLDVSRHFGPRISMGLFGQVSAIGPVFTGWEASTSRLVMGGFSFGYKIDQSAVPELQLVSRAGWGLLLMDEGNLGVSSFAIGVQTTFPLRRSLDLQLGMGYHWENPMDLYQYKDGFISGPEVSIGLGFQL
jgi:hypothetical protein